MIKTPPPDLPPVRTSPEERAFFQEVEAHFIRLRGRPLILSPRELERAACWHREGIPLQVVCRGIDRYFEKRFGSGSVSRQRAVSLQYCEDYIREVLDETRRMAVGGGSPAAGGESEDLSLGLGKLLRRLDHALALIEDDSSRPGLVFQLERASTAIQGLLDRPLTVRETEGELTKLDRDLVDQLRQFAGSAVLEELRDACTAEMREVSGKMDPVIFQTTLERMIIRRLRDARQIPELTLFAL